MRACYDPAIMMWNLSLLLLSLLTRTNTESVSTIDIKFNYVVTSTVDPLYGVSLESTVPAVNLALDYINNNSSLLPGYSLYYEIVLKSKVQ